ncbi:hypothetical protein SEGD1_106 [Enterobacteria phage SEGD1]|jgi:hypothetical protein|uniref:Uncharacterized protein n=2 Tax=Seoulvirus SPN3US TaxID=1984796 RepID=A0A142IIG7_9CAUD|nr:hypothetical protein SEGD1_106 [Enterobacteria phage SEGD1]EBX7598165.1 hypothetical protein [Salmonella enterica subsp. enterica serovar Virchow]ECD3008214.1 hypothetical protein [Salmonella enterica subsp. enterica]ECN0528029.1 hypothetical protein [Salmonella enterica subsp. enterica serovar Enteritidis]EDM3674935.1 hypothetical protein [Salmonella enterica subsp. enterica serovar Infantis]ELV6861810.1 hypothetical protein [Salmonella enterica]QNN97524.1 hypothetical protein [Proteus ph
MAKAPKTVAKDSTASSAVKSTKSRTTESTRTSSIPKPDVIVPISERLKTIHIEREFPIDLGQEIVAVNLGSDVRFTIYKGAHLNNMVLTRGDEVIGLSRYDTQIENIYPVFAVAMLRLFMQDKADLCGQLAGMADRVGHILPTLVKLYPVTIDVAFTTVDNNHGYIVLTKDGKVIAGNLTDNEVQKHMDKFAFMVNRLVHVSVKHSETWTALVSKPEL